MTSLKTVLGTTVKAMRKLKGWSQATLAEKADISTDMLGRIERGQASPSFDTVEALALALDVQPEALFGGHDLPTENSPRGKALRLIARVLAQANDDQVNLIGRLVTAVVDRTG